MSTVILRTTTRLVVPVILVVAVSLFGQGHNLPGGGFIGGVLASTAFVLVYLTNGLDYLERVLLGSVAATGGDPFEDRIVFAYRRMLVLGLVIALASGVVPLLVGEAFLAQGHTTIHGVPIYHEVEVASALAFDLGIFLVVLGGLLTVLSVVGSE